MVQVPDEDAPASVNKTPKPPATAVVEQTESDQLDLVEEDSDFQEPGPSTSTAAADRAQCAKKQAKIKSYEVYLAVRFTAEKVLFNDLGFVCASFSKSIHLPQTSGRSKSPKCHKKNVTICVFYRNSTEESKGSTRRKLLWTNWTTIPLIC